MTPIDFPETNITFKSPSEHPGTCEEVRAFVGRVEGGAFDGAPHTIVAWIPTDEEVARIIAGEAIYLSVIGILPPHYLCMDFKEARQG